MASLPYCNHRITICGSNMDKYPAKQHARAVAGYLGVSKGLMYLPGQHTVYMEDSDQTYPFRQRRYFYYLSGVDEPDCYLTYDIERDHLSLYIPPISPQRVIWFGRGSTVHEAEDKYDVDTVCLTTSLNNDIYQWLIANRQVQVYALHPDQTPHSLPPVSPRPDFDIESLLIALDTSRAIKSPHEISLIRHAVNLSSIAHRTILHQINSLRSEAQIHALFLDICIAHGAKYQGYTPIVASGTNASTLHYVKNDEPLQGRGLVCMDAGCQWRCYSSDITRTFPTSSKGWASKQTAEVYAIVEEMQERCISELGPGVRYLDLHVLAHRIAVKGLMRIGIFKRGDVDSIMEKGASKAFFPHGLGHHMGLEVHDVSKKQILGLRKKADGDGSQALGNAGSGSFGARNLGFTSRASASQLAKSSQNSIQDSNFMLFPGAQHDMPRLVDSQAHLTLAQGDGLRAPCTLDAPLLEENMVLTVEPGIYFSKYTLEHMYLPDPKFVELIDKEVLDRYMHVGGVRIEDDILITASGYENLTTAPKGKDMLEIIRKGAECNHGIDCSFI